jgi:hypothetical protein
MSRLIALIAAVCLPLTAQVTVGEKLFSLRGQTVDGGTGRPISGVSLELATPTWDPVGERISSDAEGRFLFRGLGAGRYVLSASRPDFGTVYYGERQDQGTFLTIPVGPDAAEQPVLFRILSAGTISGTVHDHYGDPVEQARVAASRLAWSEGKIVITSAGQAFTDDRGRYRLNHLRPGAYAVCAEAGSSASTPSFLEVADARMRPEAHVYARACYPAAAGPSPKSTFRIAAGQHTEVDLALETISAVSLRVRVVGGLPKSSPLVQLFRDDGIEDGSQTQSPMPSPEAPNFEFRAIEPGRYRLEAHGRGLDANGVEQSLAARLPIEVGRAGVDALELTLEPAGVIEVTLHVPGGGKLGSGVSTVGLRSAGSSPAVTHWAQTEKGALRLHDLPPGSYWLLTRTEEGVCVTSVKLGGREALHGKVTVTAGMAARLDVTLSGNCASVRGVALSGGKPAPYANVLLLLSGSAADPGDLFEESADEKGEFFLYGLGPGHYRLWAWLDDEESYFLGPSGLAAEEAKATTIVLAAGQAAKVEVALLGAEGGTR